MFLLCTSAKQMIKCLAQGHNTVPPVNLELATFDPTSKTTSREPLHFLHMISLLFTSAVNEENMKPVQTLHRFHIVFIPAVEHLK